ncbi:hypothetical protein BV25DRAFT_438153 [Artomyces pyxidatus]|uniref:Uncharacterized protein n=1 Tax=Artomyces pyxidatus TaxID=48021 RepID=A0ACB8T2J9_9AGAM|nr:hypothetical protein BV25DRAFT_438153 [Artomyces pyxidatus]
MVENADSGRVCVVCNAPASKFCSRCRTVFYCTQEHQASDWRAHKKICSTASYSTTVKDYDRRLLSTLGGPSDVPINHWLSLYMRDNHANDGSPPNQCVRALAPQAPHDWRGSLLVLRCASVQSEDGRLADAILEEDLKAVTGWLRWYGSQRFNINDLPFKPNVVVNL